MAKEPAVEFLRLSSAIPIGYPLPLHALDGLAEEQRAEPCWRPAAALARACWRRCSGTESAVEGSLRFSTVGKRCRCFWRAWLVDDVDERSSLLPPAGALPMRAMFSPCASLDEVQMLQSLGDNAFARYLLGCFWYSKRRYDEAVKLLARDARKISRLCARSSSAGRLLLE
ncbi:hypothetical protein [Klebsiella pneumoniae]